ncbi:MAG: hypothetical protein E3J46_01100 [Desulfobacteraceae bacterium]|nr:MAG: hypothetical protein E3J46_01100 [Desulfobacteraceae bacterium]
MLPVDEIAMRPNLSFLSREDKEKIDRATFKILNDIGMKIFHDEALELLKNAGCTVEEDRMVKIPGELVHQAIESAPNNIPIFDRRGTHVMDVGGHRSYFGTGSDLIYSLDSQTMQRHRCVLEDVARAAKVADALPNIDFIMSFAHPSAYAQTSALDPVAAGVDQPYGLRRMASIRKHELIGSCPEKAAADPAGASTVSDS